MLVGLGPELLNVILLLPGIEVGLALCLNVLREGGSLTARAERIEDLEGQSLPWKLELLKVIMGIIALALLPLSLNSLAGKRQEQGQPAASPALSTWQFVSYCNL